MKVKRTSTLVTGARQFTITLDGVEVEKALDSISEQTPFGRLLKTRLVAVIADEAANPTKPWWSPW
jgi:hypothetical protein